MKPIKFTLSVLFILSLLLTACGGKTTPTAAPTASGGGEAPTETAPTTAPSGPVSGGTVIIGTPQEPQILNTLLTGASIEDAVTSLFIEGLVQVNEKGEYVPVLAKDLPEVSEDGLVVTYHLREGVKWSDGLDFTCEDVVFTYHGIMSDLSQVSTTGYRLIDTIECPDPLTVEVTFSEVYAPYLRLFAYIIPRNAGEIDKMDTWAYNQKPTGTGPFVLKNGCQAIT
jgi:peptide/nickel transport system substrate-binding protein